MNTPSCQVLAFGAFAFVAACSDATPTLPLRNELTPADITGAWSITFHVDSVRECNSTTCYYVSGATLPPVTGTLVVSDQYDPLHPEFLMAEMRVDFEPALGRQITCLENPQASLVQIEDSRTAMFWFTPQAADCGIYGTAEADRTELHGTWGEATVTSDLLSRGTFRLWRKS